MSPMEWEREARNDRVRRKGSEPAWIDAQHRGLETEVSQAARIEIQQLRLDQLVREFQRLPRADRARLYESFLARLTLACNERRVGLLPNELRRREPAIRRAEDLTRSELELAVRPTTETRLGDGADVP